MKLYPKVVVIIIAVALAVSGAYAGYFHDQSVKGVYSDLTPQIYSLQNKLTSRDAQISSLSTEVSNMQGQISALNSQISTLQLSNGDLQQQLGPLKTQVAQLQASVNNLQIQLNNLQKPSMDGTFTFVGGGCFFGCSATVRGAWVNYGTQNARSVVVTLTWSKAGTFVQNNTINVGVVAGRSIGLFSDTSYTLKSQADTLDWSFDFTT
jgi:regulator of replication initiation timing